MKLLLTGSSGFIGKNLAEYLSGRYEVLAPSRVELDLLDECSVDRYLACHSVDVVIHTAGKPGHRNAPDPVGVFYADTRMYFNLVRNRERFGKLIIAGSGGIYDMRSYSPKMKEVDWKKHVPLDEHGFFRYVTAHHIETTPNVVDLRLFGVFGKYEDYAIRFISNAICKVLHDLPITIRQDRFFDYIYVKDIFPIFDHFINGDARYKEYNITNGNPVLLTSLAKIVLEISGKSLPIIVAQSGLGLEYSGDNGRLKSEMPNFAFTPIYEAVGELYGWYEENLSMINKEYLLVDK